MARSGFTALGFAVLLAAFEIGSCLKCYQCNTQQDPACGDPFKGSKHLVECNTQDSVNYNSINLNGLLPTEVITSIAGAPRYCHKITTKTGTVVRTCLDVNPTDINHTCRLLETASKIATVDSAKIKHCSVCDKDSCNGSGTTSVSLPLATLALIVTYLYCKQ